MRDLNELQHKDKLFYNLTLSRKASVFSGQ